MSLDIEFHPVVTAREARAFTRVLDDIWRGPSGDSGVPESMVIALAHAGNYAELVVRDGVPVGAALGFFAEPLGRAMHSHLVGVTKDATGIGIGHRIKLRQRTWCLERSLTHMTWTFDPLVARNAYFNIAKLGARPTTYLVDFYGSLADGVNAGQKTDRVLVSWDLIAPSAGNRERPTNAPVALTVSVDGTPECAPVPDGAHHVVIQIPRDIESLRRQAPALASRWRTALRETLTILLDSGWHVTGFDRSGAYILER